MDVGLVCDACSALTPIGVPQCTRCGAAVALDPRPKRQSRPPAVMTAPPATDGAGAPACGKCGTIVEGGQRFCPSCGSKVVIAVTFDVETRVGPRPSALHGAVAAQ